MFKVTQTINGKPTEKYVKETERAINTYKRGSPDTRKFLLKVIESFYNKVVDSDTFSKPMILANTTFTGEELGLSQSFDSEEQYKQSILASPEIKDQIVKAVRQQIKQYYTDVSIDRKKARRQIPINTNDININDISTRLDFTNNGLEIVFQLKESALERVIQKATEIYRKDHKRNEASISKLFYKHITDILSKTNNTSEYYSRLLQIGREFEGKRAVEFSTILRKLTPGVNTLKAPNVKNINQLITQIHWSEEVREQLEKTTDNWNHNAKPPYMKKRTGKFIDSVEITPSVKKQMLYMSFTPHYLRNEKFGYKVTRQVKEATEVVARRTIARMWKIVYYGE